MAIQMHPIKFTYKLKSLYKKNEEFKQGKKTKQIVAYYMYMWYRKYLKKYWMEGNCITQWRTER